MYIAIVIILGLMALGAFFTEIAACLARMRLILIIIFLLIMIVFVAYRSPDLPDYDNYFSTYIGAPSLSETFQALTSGELMMRCAGGEFETCYILLNSLFSAFGISFFGFSFIIAAVTIVLLVYGMGKLGYSPLTSAFIYFSCLYVVKDLIQVRHELSIAIIVLGFVFLRDKKWAAYYLCVVMASLLHFSNLLFLLYPLARSSGYKGFKAISFGILLFAILLQFKLLPSVAQVFYVISTDVSSKVDRYSNSGSGFADLRTILWIIEYSVLTVIYWLMRKPILEKWKEFDFVFNSILMSMLIVFVTAGTPELQLRIIQFMQVLWAIMIPSVFRLELSLSRKYLIYICMIVYCVYNFCGYDNMIVNAEFAW